MKITIEIDTAGAAFDAFECEEAHYSGREIRNTLWQAIDVITGNRFQCLDWESVLFDSNGNRCGFVRGEYDSRD